MRTWGAEDQRAHTAQGHSSRSQHKQGSWFCREEALPEGHPWGTPRAGAYNSLGCASISSLTLAPPSAATEKRPSFRCLPRVRGWDILPGDVYLGASGPVFSVSHPAPLLARACPLTAELGARAAKLLAQKVPVERKTKPTNTSPVFSSSA